VAGVAQRIAETADGIGEPSAWWKTTTSAITQEHKRSLDLAAVPTWRATNSMIAEHPTEQLENSSLGARPACPSTANRP
jgi:hypothetical protein